MIRYIIRVSLLFVFPFCFGVQPTNGQSGYQTIQMPNILPPSPEAFQLGKFGTVPVGLFTGTMNLDIPLGGISTGKINHKLGLQYSSSGVQVNLPSSRVGTGWTFVGGGVINRTVLGRDDNTYTRATPPASLTTPSNQLRNFLNDVVTGDAEPDRYSFSFDGYSGSFYFDRAGQIVTVPLIPNLKISRDYDVSSYRFTVTTPDGMKYTFGGNGASERSRTQNGGSGCGYTSYGWTENAWYLTKIKHPLGDSVVFNYNAVSFNYYSSFSQTMEKLYPYSQDASYSCMVSGTLTAPADNTSSCYTRITNEGRVLSSIVYPQGSVRINYQSRYDLPGDSCITSVDFFKTNSSTAFKRFELQQEFTLANTSYTNPIISEGAQRLFLTGVKEKDPVSGKTGQVHVFEYEDKENLPPRLSMSQDHYGFFNGASNEYFVPATSEYSSLFALANGNRAPNATYGKKGMLKKIIYPTGGYSSVIYEPNKALSGLVTYLHEGQTAVNGHIDIGGQRVQKVISYSADGNQAGVKKYFYASLANLDNSSAQLVWGPQYLSDKVVRKNCSAGAGEGGPTGDCGYKEWTVKVLSSNSLFALYGTSSGSVVYSDVVESEGENFENGGIHHKYWVTSDPSPQVMVGNTIPSSAYTNFGLFNGQEISTLLFKKNGSANVKVKEVFTSYKKMFDAASISAGIYRIDTGIIVNRRYVPACESDPMNENDLAAYDVSRYFTHSYFSYPDTVRTYTYDLSGSTAIEEITMSKYDNLSNLLVTSQQTTNSKGEVVSKEYKYPYDLKSPGNVYQKMVDANMVTPVIEETAKLGATTLYSVKTNYIDWFSNSKVLMPSTVDYTPGTGTPITRLRYHNYSQTGAILEVSKENDMRSSYLWDRWESNPVAEVKNASANEIFFDGFEDKMGWSNAGLPFDETKTHSGKVAAKITTPTGSIYTYLSDKWLDINLSSPKKFRYSAWVYSDGPSTQIYLFMKTAAETGYFSVVDMVGTSVTGKWVLLEKEFSVPANITRLNVRLDNNGGGNVWFDDVRLHPADAQMNSYTYEPLVGVTSLTDFNNRKTTYEYDHAGRLTIVRDNDGNILKKICYNYAGQPEDCGVVVYTSAAASGSFTRNNCGVGATGGTITYSVSAGTYTSTISQADANQQAINAVNAGGQAYANSNGTCTPVGCSEVNCSGENKKCVGGVCETGYKVYTSSVWNESINAYECTYHYEFSDFSWSENYVEYSGGECPIW
jgi:YD repeat-containing protein